MAAAQVLKWTSASLLACLTAIVMTWTFLDGEPAETWGPFRGRVVDADTGTPIAGAAVLVIWLKELPNPVAGSQAFEHARVAVTDAQGFWQLDRRRPPLHLAPINRPFIDFVAPGYGTWAAPFPPPAVFEMRELSRLGSNERILHGSLDRAAWIPEAEAQKLLQAANEERRRMGLRPLRSLRGDE